MGAGAGAVGSGYGGASGGYHRAELESEMLFSAAAVRGLPPPARLSVPRPLWLVVSRCLFISTLMLDTLL